MTTVAESLRQGANTLTPHSESPRLDAELLLGKILGVSRSGLRVRGTDPIAAEQRSAFDALLDRRAAGAPVAYLTGCREFWSLALTVTPDVLVPRPETELLVELALERLPADRPLQVLDLGTGSGAIALAIAGDRPRVCVTAVDVSAAALAVARHNASALRLANIEWRQGSWFDAVPGRCFDLIVANPPYLGADDAALAALVAEPRLALVSGPTGLEALEHIVDRAALYLHPQGWLLLEHGSTQSADVAQRLRARGFAGVRSQVDFADKPRVTLGTVSSSH